MSIIIIIITRIELNFVKQLRIKISIKNLTHRFDVAMASLSSEKDKTKSWLNIYALKWQNKEQSNMSARVNEKKCENMLNKQFLVGWNNNNNNNNGLFTAFYLIK